MTKSRVARGQRRFVPSPPLDNSVDRKKGDRYRERERESATLTNRIAIKQRTAATADAKDTQLLARIDSRPPLALCPAR